MFKLSTTYSPIRVLILTAMEHLIQGRLESQKNNLRNALSCVTEGIKLNCRKDKWNVVLYFFRAEIHRLLGEFT